MYNFSHPRCFCPCWCFRRPWSYKSYPVLCIYIPNFLDLHVLIVACLPVCPSFSLQLLHLSSSHVCSLFLMINLMFSFLLLIKVCLIYFFFFWLVLFLFSFSVVVFVTFRAEHSSSILHLRQIFLFLFFFE